MITVEARVVPDADGGIVAWQEAIEDPRDPLENIRRIMAEETAERFDTRTSPWGAPWEAISITTVEIRLQQGKPPIGGRFGATGTMADGGKALRFGFGSNPTPRYFHFGNPANRVFGKAPGPIPARPLLPITSSGVELPDPLRNRVMEAFADGVREGLRRGGAAG